MLLEGQATGGCARTDSDQSFRAENGLPDPPPLPPSRFLPLFEIGRDVMQVTIHLVRPSAASAAAVVGTIKLRGGGGSLKRRRERILLTRHFFFFLRTKSTGVILCRVLRG